VRRVPVVRLVRRKVGVSETQRQLEVSEQVGQQIAAEQQTLEGTLQRIEAEAQEYRKKEGRHGFANTWFRAGLAVLGVAAPALVTYQTQVEGEPLLVLLTIGLTALAGAAATLQAIFRWGDRYKQAILAAINLEELSSNTKNVRQQIMAVNDDLYQLQGLKKLNEDAGNILRTTIRTYVQAEAELATQDIAPQLPAPEAAAASSGPATQPQSQREPPRLTEPGTTT
jgi:hypothetical protein